MVAKAGEIARETAAYRCVRCLRQRFVREGTLIRPCPACGSETFQTGWRAPLKETETAS